MPSKVRGRIHIASCINGFYKWSIEMLNITNLVLLEEHEYYRTKRLALAAARRWAKRLGIEIVEGE